MAFARRRNRPTTHFSERIPTAKRRKSAHGIKDRGLFYMQQNEGRFIGAVTACVGTAYYHALL